MCPVDPVMVGRRCVGAGAMQDAGVTGQVVQALKRMSRFGCEEGGAAAPPYRGIRNPLGSLSLVHDF